MHVYFASSPSKQHFQLLIEEKVKNILVSYHYLKKPEDLLTLLDGYAPERIIIDSGAFSVWSNGGTIDIEKYATFCTDLKKVLDPNIALYIVNLDVLPGKWGFVPSKEEIAVSAELGWKNMEYLEERGLKVIHIFHQHEEWEVLDKLVAHSDYIGISPANDVSNKEKLAWMRKVFAKIKGKVKTHFFAGTGAEMLMNFPAYSADSSSWVSAARYGRVVVLSDSLKLHSFSYKDINEVEKYWKYVSDIGIDKIADKDTWKHRTRISVKAYMKLEDRITELWRNRGIVWK